MASGPRKPTPPPTAAQKRREVARLVVRLDEILKSTSELAVRARARVSVGGLTRYRRFAKRVRDFFALAAVAEEKLYGVPELAESPMATALDRMHARMVVMFVEGSAGFFDLYRRVNELPLGAHEMCGVELRGLREISKFLDDERYDGERGQALRRQAERVAQLMLDVMDRIEPLEDFGDLPSISPKGVNRQPTRAPTRQAVAVAPEPPPRPPEWRPDDWRWSEPPPAAVQPFGTAEAPFRAMSPGDLSPVGASQGGASAGGASSGGASGVTDGGDGEWVADGEYVDDDGRFDEPEAWDDEVEEYAAGVGEPGGPVPSSSGTAPEPTPLVRELTLDMVEAEERRAALNERLAAAGRNSVGGGGGGGVPPSRPAPSPSPSTPVPAPRNPAAPPVAAPSAPRPPVKAAPFRSPTVPRPPKRG